MIYVDVDVERDAVDIAATLPAGDVDDPDEVAYWIDAGCPRRSAETKPARDPKFVVVAWRASCDAPIDELTLDFTELFARDPRDEAIVSIDGGPPSTVIASHPRVVVRGRAPLDRIALAIAIVLALVLARAKDAWVVRTYRALAIDAAILVGAGAIAAAIGTRLDTAIAELVVAPAAIIVAITAVIAPALRIVPRAGVLALGAAIGSRFVLARTGLLVAIVATTIALSVILCRTFGATRYRRTSMPIVAAAIVAVGIAWLFERIADVRIFGL